MDRCTTSKVETPHHGGPAFWVPSPASDGVVDNCFPYEHKDDHWSEFSTFSNGTSCEHDAREIRKLSSFSWMTVRNGHIRDCRKHELVHAMDDHRDATEGRIQSILQREVIC